MKRSIVTLTALLALAAAPLQAQPQPQPTASAEITGSLYAPVQATDLATVAVQGGGSLPYNLAAASAQQTLRLGLEAGGSLTGGVMENLTGSVRFVTDTLPVLGAGAPGSSALFNVALRFDGEAQARTTGSGSGSAWSSTVDTALRYQVFDLDSEAWRSDREPLLDLQLWTNTLYAADGRDPGNPLSSNATRAWGEAKLADGSYWQWAGGFDDATNYPHLHAPTTTLLIDTGMLNFAVETAVGHRLFVVAQLESQLVGISGTPGQAGGSWSALAAFDKTFDAEWSALTPGVQLEGVQAGVFTAAVPEPQAWALLVAGIGLLALRRRRG